ncbi:MAG: hypothetical protein ACXAEN_25710 [Candidatus Thorarchaeota archaeon]
MTVESETQKVEYDGTGENTALTVPFIFYESSDLVVTQRITATGVGTVMTETTDYTVTGGSGSEGTVTPVDGATDFPTTVTWTIKRELPLTQEIDYIESGAFRAESHEEGLDRAVMLAQQLLAAHTRMLRIPDGDDINLDMELPAAADRASTYLFFDTDGEPTPVASETSSTVAVTTFMETLLDDTDGPAGLETLGILQDTFANIPAAGTAGRVFIATDTGLLYVDNGSLWVAQSASGQGNNLLVNGCCRVWQRGTSFTSAGTYPNNDDVPLMDHIFLLSDGNDIVDVSQETSIIPTGAYSAIKLDTETASKKFGLLFPVEARDAAQAIGSSVSLSFKARTTDLRVENLRAAILSWSSTADSITSDVVSVWAAEGTNPTWAANWTAENTPSNLALTNAYQTFTVEDVDIDTASTANIAVFIWVDDTDLIAEDLIYISEVKLEIGSIATAFSYRAFVDELALCERYFWKSFPYATAPVTGAAVAGACYSMSNVGGVAYDSDSYVSYQRMLASPTGTLFEVTGAAAGKWRNLTQSADSAAGVIEAIGENRVFLTNTQVAGDQIGEIFAIHLTLLAEM